MPFTNRTYSLASRCEKKHCKGLMPFEIYMSRIGSRSPFIMWVQLSATAQLELWIPRACDFSCMKGSDRQFSLTVEQTAQVEKNYI